MTDAVCPRCAHNHGDPWAWLPDNSPVTQHCLRCTIEFTTIHEGELPMSITATSLREKHDRELAALAYNLQLTPVEKAWVEAEQSRRDRADKTLEGMIKSLHHCVEEKRAPSDTLASAITPVVAPGAGQAACERMRLAADMLNAMGRIAKDETLARALGEIIGIPANSTDMLNAAGRTGQLLMALSRLRS